MHVIYDTIKFSRPGPCAITLGKFDGVHRAIPCAGGQYTEI